MPHVFKSLGNPNLKLILDADKNHYVQFHDGWFIADSYTLSGYLDRVSGVARSTVRKFLRSIGPGFTRVVSEEGIWIVRNGHMIPEEKFKLQYPKEKEGKQMSQITNLDAMIELRKKTEEQYEALPVYAEKPGYGGTRFTLVCPFCKAEAVHDFTSYSTFSGSQPIQVGIQKPSIRTKCHNCGYERNFKVVLDEAKPDEIPVEAHVRRKRRTKAEIDAEKTAAAPEVPSAPVPGDPDFIGPVNENPI